ncbi:hypothetical protein LTR94_031118, partial [Friedmanniomyces endolithicus]
MARVFLFGRDGAVTTICGSSAIFLSLSDERRDDAHHEEGQADGVRVRDIGAQIWRELLPRRAQRFRGGHDERAQHLELQRPAFPQLAPVRDDPPLDPIDQFHTPIALLTTANIAPPKPAGISHGKALSSAVPS